MVTLSSSVRVWGWLRGNQPSLNLQGLRPGSGAPAWDSYRPTSTHQRTGTRKCKQLFFFTGMIFCSSTKSQWKVAENNGWKSSDVPPGATKLMTLTSADRWGSGTRLFYRTHLKEGDVRLHLAHVLLNSVCLLFSHGFLCGKPFYSRFSTLAQSFFIFNSGIEPQGCSFSLIIWEYFLHLRFFKPATRNMWNHHNVVVVMRLEVKLKQSVHLLLWDYSII